ncbi:MAG TPA: hypothetical protein VLM37_06410 [Fibrobacteraceae bacterium]|nr:hypothetical protein [Fibrobacteraceae bacterium]
MTPLFQREELGRRKDVPIQFHPNGNLRTLSLQSRSTILTQVGSIPAELLSFFPEGGLRKIFPSSGRISGFWTEEQEYQEAPSCEIKISTQSVRAKIISIQFYPEGTLHSFTLWPQEHLFLQTNIGPIQARTGVAFHPNGQLRSYEPIQPVWVSTPIGEIEAFDPNPLGVSGDHNSLEFDPVGKLTSLVTISSAIHVFPKDGPEQVFAPQTIPSFCSENSTEPVGFKISFHDEKIFLGRQVSFPLTGTRFQVEHKGTVLTTHTCHS